MNLLEKYKAIANTGERKEVKNTIIENLPVISAYPPPVISTVLAAPTMPVIWENPHPRGTQAARDFSRQAVEQARGLN